MPLSSNHKVISKEMHDTNRLLELVSSKVGVIRSLSPMLRGAEEPNPPFLYQALLSHFDFRKAPAWERSACGKGLTEFQAIQGAIGEAIERYCASHCNSNGTRLGPWTSVAPSAVAPNELVLYSANQYRRPDFPYRPWDPLDEITWLPLTELPMNQQIFCPAAFIFLALSENYKQENHFCPPTSNGLAAGPTREFAILRGLCELIERDSFLISWMNQLPAPEVEFSNELAFASSIREHYRRFGIEIHIFDISTDLPIYVMMGLAVDRSGQGPAAVVGLGCHLDPCTAITNAVLEVCQVRPGELQRLMRERPAEKLTSYNDVRTLQDHSAYFHPVERLREFAFLLDNGRKRQIATLPDRSRNNTAADLDFCLTALRASGSRVLFADLTTPDIAPYGLRVVRTIVTGLQPMHFGHGQARLGGHRLYETPKALGYSSDRRGESDLNPCPHPLA